MIRTASPQDRTMSLIKQNIKAYNKYMSDEYLQTLSVVTLLRLCHPEDRPAYADRCHKLRMINIFEFRECHTKWELIKTKNENKKRFVRTKK